jgi:hypothetical protein
MFYLGILCHDDGSGVAFEKSLAAHDSKVTTDQNYAFAQYRYGLCLANGSSAPIMTSLAGVDQSVLGN